MSTAMPTGLSVPLSLNSTYTTRLAQLVQVSSDGSGVISSQQLADPTAGGQNFAEYPSLAELYGEVKLVQFGIQIIPALAFDEKSNAAFLAIGGVFNGPITSPTPSTVLSLVNSRLYNIGRDTSARGTIISVIPRPSPIFAESINPAGNTGAGTSNCTIYLEGAGFPASTVCLNLMVYGVYTFRTRR